MARRTKEEAFETRQHILDAAEKLFYSNGVSKTSLQAIAQQAGITRGSIYWHFKDKADLFNAMVDRIIWPFDKLKLKETQLNSGDASFVVDVIKRNIQENLQFIATNPQVQRVLYIAEHQLELVAPMEAVIQKRLQNYDEYFECNVNFFSMPELRNLLRPEFTPEDVARTLQNAICQMVNRWLLAPSSFDLVQSGTSSLSIIIRGALQSEASRFLDEVLL